MTAEPIKNKSTTQGRRHLVKKQGPHASAPHKEFCFNFKLSTVQPSTGKRLSSSQHRNNGVVEEDDAESSHADEEIVAPPAAKMPHTTAAPLPVRAPCTKISEPHLTALDQVAALALGLGLFQTIPQPIGNMDGKSPQAATAEHQRSRKKRRAPVWTEYRGPKVPPSTKGALTAQ
jgi:hypothetical protein